MAGGPWDSWTDSRVSLPLAPHAPEGGPAQATWRELVTCCLPSLPGWIFGERLHDQERGWFPSNMTEEILNPKIRSQNLKECFRVHKMDDPQRSQNKDRRKLGSRNRQ